MSEFVKILIYVAIGLAVASAVIICVKAGISFYKKEEKIEEPVVEPATEETCEEVCECEEAPVEEEPAPAEELVIGDANQGFGPKKDVKRIPFSIKLLSLGVKTEEYFDAVYNELISYRKINARISQKFVSFRYGRDLVARFAIRGKTMKLYLALDVKDFNEKIYFQKDASSVKTYLEVPFSVKVKSDRGCKNALKLVEALAQKHGLQKKSRFVKIDSLALIKQALI